MLNGDERSHGSIVEWCVNGDKWSNGLIVERCRMFEWFHSRMVFNG